MLRRLPLINLWVIYKGNGKIKNERKQDKSEREDKKLISKNVETNQKIPMLKKQKKIFKMCPPKCFRYIFHIKESICNKGRRTIC